MSRILPLIFEPDPILHQKSEIVSDVTKEIQDFSQDLILTMQHHKGLGLAAVQVGVLKKIIALDIKESTLKKDHDFLFDQDSLIMINPEIIDASKEKASYKEGCLSFGFIYPEVIRPNQIKVKYKDLSGKERIVETKNDIMSACIQHEIDHTNGIVFLDKLSRMKREFMMKKCLKMRKLQKT